jgi:hypothetical protein
MAAHPLLDPSYAVSHKFAQFISKTRALSLLRTSVGSPIANFHPDQWEAIQLLLHRERMLVVERTGWGKSSVYFLATRHLRDTGSGCTLLISPLLSLMRNQIDGALRIGVRAETINSSNANEWPRVLNALRQNRPRDLLQDAALVIAWSDQEGGTWAGAVEALRLKQIPVYVKGLCQLPAGNRKMIQAGAQESPLEPWIDLRQLFAKPSLPNTLPPAPDPHPGRSGPAEDHNQAPTDAYHYIIEIILDLLAEPMDAESLTAKLNVSAAQARAWLKRAVEEGKIEKTKAPLRYVRKANALPLFPNDLKIPGLKLLELASTKGSSREKGHARF